MKGGKANVGEANRDARTQLPLAYWQGERRGMQGDQRRKKSKTCYCVNSQRSNFISDHIHGEEAGRGVSRGGLCNEIFVKKKKKQQKKNCHCEQKPTQLLHKLEPQFQLVRICVHEMGI